MLNTHAGRLWRCGGGQLAPSSYKAAVRMTYLDFCVHADIPARKHASHAITADISLGETAAAAEFMRADAVIVTGLWPRHLPDVWQPPE